MLHQDYNSVGGEIGLRRTKKKHKNNSYRCQFLFHEVKDFLVKMPENRNPT